MGEAYYKLLEHEVYADILAEQINLAITVKGAILKYEQAGVSTEKAADIVQSLVAKASHVVSNIDV